MRQGKAGHKLCCCCAEVAQLLQMQRSLGLAKEPGLEPSCQSRLRQVHRALAGCCLRSDGWCSPCPLPVCWRTPVLLDDGHVVHLSCSSRTGVPLVMQDRRVAGQVRICRSRARLPSGGAPAQVCSTAQLAKTIGTALRRYPAALRTAFYPPCPANPRESQHAARKGWCTAILQDGGQSGHARVGSASAGSASTGLAAVDQVPVRADPRLLWCALSC